MIGGGTTGGQEHRKYREEKPARRAKRPEEEVRDILRNAVRGEETPSGGLGTDISSLFAKVGLHSDIAELHGHAIVPAQFET